MMMKDSRKRILLPIILGIMMFALSLTAFSLDDVYAASDNEYISVLDDNRYVDSGVQKATDEVMKYDFSSSADYKKCVEKVRKELKNHSSSIRIEIIKNSASVNEWATIPVKLFNEATSHTGNGDEGDYIRYQISGYKVKVSIYSNSYIYEYCDIGYFTTLAQEEAVTAECSRIIKSLNLSGLDNYTKIYKIYNYLCKNVTYDWAGYYNNSTNIEHSAYSALIRKTAVCQGYSVALYRLLLQAGIDARVVTGYLCGEGHSWNIVKLGSLYYCLDATNDAGYSSYNNFLREDNYDDHVRKINAYEEDFDKNYPISSKRYAKEAPNSHSYGSPTWKWTGTDKAVATFVCKNDSSHVKKVTAKISVKTIKKATINAAGKKKYTAKVTLNGKTYQNTKTVEYYLFDKSKTGIQKYNGVMYYTKKGIKLASFTGFAKYSGNWYYVKSGKVNSSLTAIVKGKVNGEKASWYVKNGKVRLDFTGTVKIGSKTYKIKKGKVQ